MAITLFKLNIKDIVFFQKICKMLKTSMSDYEKLN